MDILKTLKTKLNFNDISIVPASLSEVRSRSECKTRYLDGTSPYFVAPMDTVISEDNLDIFLNSGLNVCMPRGMYLENDVPNVFESYSLDEFIEKFTKLALEGEAIPIYHWNVHIDIANGHMMELFQSCIKAKKIWGSKLKLMVGNIANPKTYHELAEIGVDYVKLGIGMGAACTTTSHTGVHFPIASLIMECKSIQEKYSYKTKIIADGGISSTADVNKALACGADFVMMGSMFNKTYEACGQAYLFKRIPIPNKMIKPLKNFGFKIHRKYRGMSTKEVQKSWGKKILRPSEGIHKLNEVLYPLDELISNLDHRLATAMSYCGDFELETYTSGENELVQITSDTYNRVNKL